MNRRQFLKRIGGLTLAAAIAPKVAIEAVARFATTSYGEISPRMAGVWTKKLLSAARPKLVISKFGQTRELPPASEKVKWRRYEAMPTATGLNNNWRNKEDKYGF